MRFYCIFEFLNIIMIYFSLSTVYTYVLSPYLVNWDKRPGTNVSQLTVFPVRKNVKFTIKKDQNPNVFFLAEHCRRTIFHVCICFRVFSKRIFRDMTYFVERNIGFTFSNDSQYSIPKHWLDLC